MLMCRIARLDFESTPTSNQRQNSEAYEIIIVKCIEPVTC